MDKRIIGTVKVKGKEYPVRGLDFDDTEIISIILDKTDFDFAKYEAEAQKIVGGDVQKSGMSLFLKAITDLVKKYHKAHGEFTVFVASLIDVEVAALKKMPITAPILILKELAKDEDSRDFFSFLKQ